MVNAAKELKLKAEIHSGPMGSLGSSYKPYTERPFIKSDQTRV